MLHEYKIDVTLNSTFKTIKNKVIVLPKKESKGKFICVSCNK